MPCGVNNKKQKIFPMFKNYFNIAIRNFRRYLGYTTINVAGLAVGLATAIFILLWVSDEMSYDSFHENRNTLYGYGTMRIIPMVRSKLFHRPLHPLARLRSPRYQKLNMPLVWTGDRSCFLNTKKIPSWNQGFGQIPISSKYLRSQF